MQEEKTTTKIKNRLKSIMPETYLISFLIILYLHSINTAIFGASLENFMLHMILAPITAAAVDVAINYAKTKKIIRPDHAVISGLIIALIVLPGNILFSFVVPSIAMLLKHAIRYKGRNVFNPTALGIFISVILFSVPNTWWMSSFLILPFGIFIAWKIRSLTISISFIAVYYLAFFVQGIFFGMNYILLFFAFVMVLEPVTSAHTKKGKIVFGSLVGLLAAFGTIFPADPFLFSLLAVNPLVYILDRKLR